MRWPRRPLIGLLALLMAAAITPRDAIGQSSTAVPRTPMLPSSLLIHITAGPNDPTRAALGFNVARAAIEAGHRVSIFLAGDAVQLIRADVLASLVGLGTGSLKEHFDAVVAKGGRLYLSGGSSKARGVTDADLAGKSAEFAGPPQLVQLSLSHDRVLTY